METSSVFMCFPCYQEFNTLEEVLKHQLTCTAEDDQQNASKPTAVALQQFQTQVLHSAKADEEPQLEPDITPVINALSEDAGVSEQSPDQPRILYQCGDCDDLFKSLDLWQEHRKGGTCYHSPSASKSKQDFGSEMETVSDENTSSALNPENSSNFRIETSENLNPESVEAAVKPLTETETENEEVSLAQSSEATELVSNVEDSSPSKKRGANKKPKPEPVLLCVDCGSCFGLVSELVSHRKTQHGFEEVLHRCNVCGESFLNTTLFLYHRKQHRQTNESKTVLPELTPGEVCTQSNGADEQEQDVRPSTPTSTSSFMQPELFMCTKCGESFSNETGLVTHRKQKHSLQEAIHNCSLCGQGFMNTTQYLYHRRQHHNTSGTVLQDAAETSGELATNKPQDSQQTSKRSLSPSASASESGSPHPKRNKSESTVSPLKGNKFIRTAREQSDGNAPADSDATNLPPPAKLLQDWARTQLPHVCPYCGKTFTRRVFLRSHVFTHTGEKLFTCKVCPKAFSNSQSLLRHSLSHTGVKPYYCDVCGKNFSQPATLKRHQLIHKSTHLRGKRGRKPVCTLDNEGMAHLFPCPNCPSRFNTEEQLNHHKLLHTSHPFPCAECGEAFKRRKDLDLHSLMHQDKQPATCPHCLSQFVNQSVLEIHMQRCPTSEEERNAGRGRGQGRGRCTGQIECDLCGHRCMTQEGLDLHRLSHTGQTPLKCPVKPCRRRFISNAALEEHVLAHIQGTLSKTKNRPNFRCEICHKEFSYNSTFNVHMRTHTDERPFECATCGKRFRQLPHLQDHERIHSGLRPFCCWICGKSFSVAARLTEHARTHSGEKPYPCPHCPAAFRSRSNLDKHIKLHGDIPPETAEEVAQAAEAAQVQKVLEGAQVLSSLASTVDGETTSVQTIYVLQGTDESGETVMIPSDQLSAMEGSSQVVILPSSVLESQAISVPTITMVETGQSPQHAIEFIVEETV